MVSYYNSLSSMFPAHHATQPHSVAAVAARHAATYFQGYHPHHYGYPQHHHHSVGFAPSATSPGNVTSTTTPTVSQYPQNISDLNSNVCAGGSVPSASLPGSGFGPGVISSHHQHLEGGNGFQSNPAITPPAWHASQSVWHPSSPFWGGSCNIPGGQGMDGVIGNEILPTTTGSSVPVSARSPDTPPRGSSESLGMRVPSAASPGYANGSNSSGSPSGTPTPGGVSGTYPGDFNDYGSYPQHQQQNPGAHRSDSPSYKDDDHDGLSPSPMSPPMGGSSLRPQPARSPYEWMKKPSYQSQPDKSGRTRTKDKYRVVYSDHQRLELEKEFHYSRYITIRRKAELANSVGLSERQVKIWFQNRRAKERRALKKHEDVIMKEKLESAASFGAAMSFSESIHHAGNLGMPGSCHTANAAMMGGHAISAFPPHSLASSILSSSPQMSIGVPMKYE